MKFTVEIDDESAISSIEYEIGEEIARKVADKLNFKSLEKGVAEEIRKRKDELLKQFTGELNDWDKSRVYFDLAGKFDQGWRKMIATEVLDIIRKDSTFVGQVAKEIVKLQFNGKE